MKEFVLTLDKPRKLVFDYDAIEKIREKFGIAEDDSQELFQKMNIDTRTLPFLINVGLIWEDPSLTEEDTKKLLNESIRTGTYAIIDHLEIVTRALVYQQTGKEVSIKKTIDKMDISKAGVEFEEPENLASSPQTQKSAKSEK